MLSSACQFFFGRPLLGRQSSRPRSLPGEGDHDVPEIAEPGQLPFSVGAPLSSSLPACCTPALVAGVSPLSVVAPGPDVDAFMGGVVLGLTAAFLVLVALGGLAIVRRILGS